METTTTTTKPKRRIRVKKSSILVNTSDKTVLTKTVNEYAKLQLEIEEKQRQQVELLADLSSRMKSCGIKEWKTKLGKGERYVPTSRSTTIIDTQAFRERVTDDDFMESVKVSVTAARKVLSGKELDSISEVVQGAKKEEQCRVDVFNSKA